MITFLSKWIEQIAIAVILASIFEILLPNGNLKKYIKVVLGIYIVFNIISPFVDSNAIYSFNISNEIDEYSSNITNSVTLNKETSSGVDLEKIYLDELESQIINTIEKQGYIVSSCNVDVVLNSEKDDAGIKKISVVLSGKSIEKEDDANLETEEAEETEKVKEIEKVEINVGENSNTVETESSMQKITEAEIIQLKKYLSEHYEIDRKIISIQTK